MTLVFCSGNFPSENGKVDDFASAVLPGRRMAFIPSASEGAEGYFSSFEERMLRFGAESVEFCPTDVSFAKRAVSQLLNFDAIFLSGGNTFYFLKQLQACGALPILRKFVEEGGLLIGQSAGAVIMTHDIKIAGLPGVADENAVGLKKLSSLNLVNFEFFPHYHLRKHDTQITRYAKASKRPIYACDETSFVVVEREEVMFLGQVYCFVGKERFRV